MGSISVAATYSNKNGFPNNVLGMLITAVCWGFFEGFNYAVIADKISERYPSKTRLWDWGALVCAFMCILVHGVIGITPEDLLEKDHGEWSEQ